jgi:hypothetical protein
VSSVSYAYDTLGRFSAVSWTIAGTTRTATYARVENSELLAGWEITSGGSAATLTVRRQYEANRDLILSVSNLWGNTPISVCAYENDELARRTRRVDNASVTNDFGYNLRSELATALMGTNVYGYVYDPIGNRLVATNNAEVWTYLSNQLNQYTNIADGVTNTLFYDLDGNLTNDGVRAYSWDGENRLASVSSNGTLPSHVRVRLHGPAVPEDQRRRDQHFHLRRMEPGSGGFHIRRRGHNKLLRLGAGPLRHAAGRGRHRGTSGRRAKRRHVLPVFRCQRKHHGLRQYERCCRRTPGI